MLTIRDNQIQPSHKLCAYIYIMHILCDIDRELQSNFMIQFNQTAHFTSLRDTFQDVTL